MAAAGSSQEDQDEDDDDDDDDALPQARFLLDGPRHQDNENSEKDEDGSSTNGSLQFSSSSSWQDRINCDQLTALVRDKSRSVQDLMILTHVEPMSDVEMIGRSFIHHAAAVAEMNDERREGTMANHEVTSSISSNSNSSSNRHILPQISVTSPSSTVRSAHAQSDIPLLDSTDAKLVLNI